MRYSLKKIREDLKPLSEFEVVPFGSYVTGAFREGSDIDVAVIARNIRILLLLAKVLRGFRHRIYLLREL